MRIAYITSHPDMRGGGERFIYETALRMQNLGHEVMIFCNSMEASKAYPEMLEIPHKVFPARRNLFGYFNAYFRLKAFKKLIEEADKWRSDIIFLHRGSLLANYFQKLTQIPIVPYFHVSASPPSFKKNWIRSLYRKILIPGFNDNDVSFEDVPLILCNSHYTERTIRKLAPDANVKVIYPGVDHNRFKPTWKEQGYLYYHSRICPQKNQLLAIQAVRGRYPLILLGTSTDQEYSLKVQEEAKKYGHKVLTDDSNLIPLLQNCSVFLFPAIRESFGIAPIEAMACGKPVIAHKSGGVIETVGKVGILCGDNVEEWREEIDYLMENPDIRRDLGKKSYEFSKKFTWESTVNQMVESFKALSE